MDGENVSTTGGPRSGSLLIHPRIGLGAMPLSVAGRPERTQAIRVVHAALDAGARMIDTADAYCSDASDTGHNEELIAEALAAWDGPVDEVTVATKGGHIRDAAGGWATDGRPEHLVSAARASRERLGVEAIDLYYFHRPDPAVPFLESVDAVASLLDDGVVRRVGLSNVDVAQLAAAAGRVRISAVQNSASVYDRSSDDVLTWCHAQGVPFLAWAPLGGWGRAPRLGEDELTAPHARVAAELRVSVAQVVLAWLLARSPVVMAIPGARRVETILDAIAAADLDLSPDHVALLR